jgi:hypothetical protein
MRKFERKARLKAMKRAAKEAKQAQREAAPAVAVDGAQLADVGGVPAQEATPTATGEASVPREALPEAAIRAARALSEARAQAKSAAAGIGEADARAMLSRALDLADSVVQMTRATLVEIPLPRLREAYEIVNARPEPADSQVAPQKRPRRGYDPVVSLVKTGLAAARRVARLVVKLYPNLGRRAA